MVLRSSLVLLATFVVCAVAAAQTPRMLSDLHRGPVSSSLVSSIPHEFVSFGNRILFVATGPRGRELYSCDPASLNVTEAVDVAPGPASSSPEHLTVVGGLCYFSAIRSGIGRELFVTDGTAVGTRLLGDLTPGVAGSSPY